SAATASSSIGSRSPFGARPTLGSAAKLASDDADDDDEADAKASDEKPATPAAKPSTPFGAGGNRPGPFGKPATPASSTGTSAAAGAMVGVKKTETRDKPPDEPAEADVKPAATVSTEKAANNRPSPFGAPTNPFGKPTPATGAKNDAADDLD